MPFDTEDITRNAKKIGEKKLRKVIEELFDSTKVEISYNVKKEANLQKNHLKRIAYHELDVWIPKLNIGFEYQVAYDFPPVMFVLFSNSLL